MNNEITGIDLVLILFYILLILMIGYGYSRKFNQSYLRRYFMQGLLLKLVCGLGFGATYVYYYGGGDTQMYFRGAAAVYEALFSGKGFNVFFDNSILTYGSMTTRFTQRIAGFVNLFALNSFWSCTLLFAALSFIGLWLIFTSFNRLFPHLHKQLAIAALFVPGVVFWSSGIMKDSICMLFVGVIVYAVQNIFLFDRKKFSAALLLIAGFYTLVNLKAYIAMAMLVAIALYALLGLKSRIRNSSIQVLVMPLAAVVIMWGAALAMNRIGESLERYSFENIMETAQTYQGYHARTSVAGRGGSAVRTGSGYTLGDIDYSNPLSIAAKFPLAINVTFFRPYLWEVRNPVMLLSALESTIILLFTLGVIWRNGIIKFFKAIFTRKEVLFCLTFALIFGFAVGFTTYNFGSLVRYKAPCVPFFLIGLVLINEKYYVSKMKAKAPVLSRAVAGKQNVQSNTVQS
jgi:hypothetical protein